MQKTITVPLRERNRLDTWALIHDTASSMVLEAGLTKATVEAIAEASGVSKRTFFNYFATKEDAIMGTQPPTLPDEAVAVFRANSDGDLLGRTAHLMVAVIRTMFPEASQRERRMKLKDKYPELSRAVFHHISASEALVETILMDRYEDNSPEIFQVGLPGGREHAQALLMLAGTAVRFAFGRDPAAVSASDNKSVEDSVEIFREAMRASL